MSEKESMERLSDVQLAFIIVACEQGGNQQKLRVAQEILDARKRKEE